VPAITQQRTPLPATMCLSTELSTAPVAPFSVAPGAVLSLRRQSYPQFVPTLTPLAIPRLCQAR